MSDEVSTLLVEHTKKDMSPVAPSGVVVSGEASESDEDDIPSPSSPVHLPPLRVDRGSPNLEEGVDNEHTNRKAPQPRSQPKYKSLLHTKLWEKNAALSNSLHDRKAQLFTTSARELVKISQNLSKSLINTREVCNHMQQLTNDLFHLEDKLDIAASCNLLPDISINVQPSEATTSVK